MILSQPGVAGSMVFTMLAPCGGAGRDRLPDTAVCTDNPADQTWYKHDFEIEFCAKGCAIRDAYAAAAGSVRRLLTDDGAAPDPFKANCSVVPPRRGLARQAGTSNGKRIRWFVGNSANWGCLLSPDNYSDITDGVIQCCNGVGFDASGSFVAPGKGFFGPFQSAGKEVFATVQMYASNSTSPGGDLCTGMLEQKHQIAQEMLAAAKTAGLAGYNLDIELGYNNSVGCWVELWTAVGAVLRAGGVQLGTDIDQSCLKLPGFPGPDCGPTEWSYEWDYASMIPAFDYFTEMATYPSNHDRPAAENLQPAPCVAAPNRTCGIKGYILDLIAHGMPRHKISTGLSVSGLPGQIGCGEPSDGCGTIPGCNASFNPHGSMSGSGWTRSSLREFLAFLDREGVTSIDLWTGDAFELPESVAICSWIIEELRAWRHG